MDSSENIQTPFSPPSSLKQPSSSKKRYIYLSIIFVMIIAAALLIYFYPQIKNIVQNPFRAGNKLINQNGAPSAEKIIAKVGEENIYQKDLDTALNGFPKMSTASQSVILKQQVFNQLIQDSIILQGGQADGLIKLDSTTFNSSTKDIAKRTLLVEKIKKAIFDQSPGSKGMVAAIWYKQADKTLSLTAAKSLANKKISQLYQEVATGKITIEQAIENIKTDTSLAKLDPNYQINAGFAFSSQKDRPATIYPEFDKTLQSLKPGETSPIYEAAKSGFLFGQVSKVVTNTTFSDFTTWLAQKQKIYPVEIFKQ